MRVIPKTAEKVFPFSGGAGGDGTKLYYYTYLTTLFVAVVLFYLFIHDRYRERQRHRQGA